MPFSSQPLLEPIDGRLWRVARTLEYRGRSECFVIPAGFVTDLASVPECLRWYAPAHAAYTPAAILHDFLWGSRADADGLFRRVLRELDVPLHRRWAMWAAVRAASGLSGATAGDVARFLLVAVVAVPLLAVPTVVVLVAQTLAHLLDLCGGTR